MVFDSYFTSIWCVIITMTTVGYGDTYAVSPFGRSVSVFNALWGTFIISLITATIKFAFDLND
jgi:voltage-gated potassium channel